MTYFETPTAQAAHFAGLSEAAFLAREEAREAEAEALYMMGEPHLDVEDRERVSEDDMPLYSRQDQADLEWVLDWEQYHL